MRSLTLFRGNCPLYQKGVTNVYLSDPLPDVLEEGTPGVLAGERVQELMRTHREHLPINNTLLVHLYKLELVLTVA